MSKFKEGWCRTAHEAMLLKTPVIGSRPWAAMKELLDGGKQTVCQDFKNLEKEIEYLLKHPMKEKKWEKTAIILPRNLQWKGLKNLGWI